MEQFDSKKHINNLLEEFKRTEEFHNSFRNQFIINLFLAIKKNYKKLKLTKEMDDILRLYANEMLSCAESVLYKDATYPNYRLEEELGLMIRIATRTYESHHNIEFIEQVHKAAKEMLVNNYPEIFDLSANGFRLLEKYSRMYNWLFVTNFYAISII